MKRRFPVLLTLFTAAAFALLVGLGVWQLKRLEWKRDLIARIDAAMSAPAAPVVPTLARMSFGDDVGYTRVTAICPGLSTAPFVELYALRDGNVGSRLISACKLEGTYGSILVDRGFVQDIVSSRPPVDPADPRPNAVRGILRAPDAATVFTPDNDLQRGRFFSRDIPAIAKALNAPDPAPLFLMAETSTNPEWKALVPAPVPTALSNRHLEYAITWFGLAGALLGVYAAVLFGRRRKV